MIRWPLSRKIVGLALLNLALLLALAGALAVSQFQLAPESLLLAPARDRLESIANDFSNDYATTAPQDRAGLLAAYSRRYHAQAIVAEPRGEVIAGPPGALSRELLDHMRRVMPPPNQAGPPPLPPPDAPPPPEKDFRKGGRRPPPPGRRDLPPESVFLAITPEGYWAGARITVPPQPDGGRRYAVLLLRSESLFNSALFFDWRLWGGVVFAVVLVTALCWLPFVRGLTRSIAEMDRLTGQIAQGRFDARIEAARGDELGDLAIQINSLAARVESFVTSQKRFLGDIAHELCSPIARVQFALGILDREVPEEARPPLATLYDEVQEMSALVNELLSFSKAGLNAQGTPLGPIDVAAVVDRAAARESRPEVRFEIDVTPGLQAVGNEAYVVRAIANVLRNAVRYAGNAGPISIGAARRNGQVTIVVRDHGPGLPDSELEQVFEPFYRPEAARTRETGGAGLGLAIVRTCVEACGGTVACRNRQPAGLEVEIRLKSEQSAEG